MTAIWTLPERRLISELSVGIARRLTEILQPSDGVTVCHGFQSPFDKGCRVLWQLGVAYGADGARERISYDEDLLPAFFKLLSPDAIRSTLSDGPLTPAPTVFRVLTCYLSIACDYGGGDILPCRREPFHPPAVFAKEISALKKLGYIDRLGTVVIWTDKIASAMVESYLWQADGQSVESVVEANIREACETALSCTPEHTIRTLTREAASMSELDFATLLLKRFDGLFWTKNPDGTARSNQGDVTLLKAIYYTLRAKG
ncbi:hypothetical protein [Bradyrhizobium sp. HKCCYLS2033]|uniref:hypothetical protein n=1 Tax=unclassified Bradyrhizobium TaxID=2631580 RepID=UPI003EB9EDB5